MSNMHVAAKVTGVWEWKQVQENWKDVYKWVPEGSGTDSVLLNSYAAGDWSEDSLDDLYNIDGVGKRNQLVNGIVNKTVSRVIKLSVEVKATINNKPVELEGMVLADAESMATNEGMLARAKGTWNIIDFRNGSRDAGYFVKKYTENSGQNVFEVLARDASSGPSIGVNSRASTVVSFVRFDAAAYDRSNGNAVSFEAELRGGGKTAIAIGILPPSVDMGDAPESYGNAFHMQEPYAVSDDSVTVENSKKEYNIKKMILR